LVAIERKKTGKHPSEWTGEGSFVIINAKLNRTKVVIHEKAKPVAKQGRKTTGLSTGSRVAKGLFSDSRVARFGAARLFY
jgi:hypothetical protein